MKRLYFSLLLFISILLYTNCPLFLNQKPYNKETDNEEPTYNIPVIWKSDVARPFTNLMIYDETGVYIYSYEEGNFAKVKLNRIDSKNGDIIWSTPFFENDIQWCQPLVVGDYIYVFIVGNLILCFNKESGIETARARFIDKNKEMLVYSDYYLYDDYLYFGFGDSYIRDHYLARFNTNLIINNNNLQEQLFEPELLWKSHYDSRIRSRPIVYNDIVYCNTITLNLNIPIEIAGIDINTKEEVFYDSIGGDGFYIFEGGSERNSFYIKNNTLYFLSQSIASYDLNNYKKLYHIIFDINTPRIQNYGAGGFLEATFYKDNIYYTTNAGNVFGEKDIRNIFCINKDNGKLVWSAIAKKSEGLGTNPIIYDNKVFIPHMNGIRVYNADNGDLIGVEKSIECGSTCINQLYGSTMITEMYDPEFPGWRIAAFDLSK